MRSTIVKRTVIASALLAAVAGLMSSWLVRGPFITTTSAAPPFIIDTGQPDLSTNVGISGTQFVRISFRLDRPLLINRIEVFLSTGGPAVRFRLTETVGPGSTPPVLIDSHPTGQVTNTYLNIVPTDVGPISLEPRDYHLVISTDQSGSDFVGGVSVTSPNIIDTVSAYFAQEGFGLDTQYPPASSWFALDPSTHYPGFRVAATCNSDQDCDDGNVCTADSCTSSGCVNTEIPGCINKCGNGTVDPGEDCDRRADTGEFGPCCDPNSCRFRRSTFLCRAATTTCAKDALCSTDGDDCPANQPEPNDKPCADGDPCTEQHCQGGACTIDARICSAAINNVKFKRSRPPRILLRCSGRPQQGQSAILCSAEEGFVVISGEQPSLRSRRGAGIHPAPASTPGCDAPGCDAVCKRDGEGNRVVTKAAKRRVAGDGTLGLRLNRCGRCLYRRLQSGCDLNITIPGSIDKVQTDPTDGGTSTVPVRCLVQLARGQLKGDCPLAISPGS